MNYELAKELKDAGFAQPENIESVQGDMVLGDDLVYRPTLSELIESCGERGMFDLKRQWGGEDEGWIWTAATPHVTKRLFVFADSKTPEEAVARLWLALNKK